MQTVNKVLIIGTHPDDETLGCGGTILRYRQAGSRVWWLNVTNMKEEYGFGAREIRGRAAEIGKVAKVYGFEDFFDLGLKPAGLDRCHLASIVRKISVIIERVKPDSVILPYRYDLHSDHRIVYDASSVCMKAFRFPYIRKVMMMEVLSETVAVVSSGHGCAFAPNYFVDISAHLEKKIKTMSIYAREMGAHPFPRSAEGARALAVLRGASAGMKYAEGFVIIKETW